MSTNSGIVVCEDKKKNKNTKRKDVQIPVYITLFQSLVIQRRCVNHNSICPDGKINGLSDSRMCGLPTGGKPESFHRGKLIFMSQVFSK